MRMMPERQIHA